MATTTNKKIGRPKKVIEQQYLCPYCGKEKNMSGFYSTSDPLVLTGITHMCRECAEKIARNYNPATKLFGDCTKLSIQEALERLDKPFITKIYDSSIKNVNAPSHKGKITNVWAAYMRSITLPVYKAMRWRDSDIFKSSDYVQSNTNSLDKNYEIQKEYDINRHDAIRIIGYDPFSNYPIEEDKPILYAQLISFIDDETKNDGMKMNAVIQIVQAFNQIQKINDAINMLSSDVSKLNNNNGTIKQHAETINKLLSGANALAKDNGISVNFNNSKSKGQNTLTGKMKELELIGFRDSKINMYDVDYCTGMRQVAEISAKAQVEQIGFDENVMDEINSIRRELVDTLQKERDQAVERARILLVENRDLKQFLKDKKLIDDNGEVILDG